MTESLPQCHCSSILPTHLKFWHYCRLHSPKEKYWKYCDTFKAYIFCDSDSRGLAEGVLIVLSLFSSKNVAIKRNRAISSGLSYASFPMSIRQGPMQKTARVFKVNDIPIRGRNRQINTRNNLKKTQQISAARGLNSQSVGCKKGIYISRKC